MNILKENGEISVNDLHRKLGCNKNNLIMTYKKMVEDGYINLKKQDNEIIISVNFTDMNKFFSNLDYMIKQSVKISEQCIDELKNSTRIFKSTKTKEKDGSVKTIVQISNEEDGRNFGLICAMLNNLGYYSLGLTYADSLNLIQEKLKREIPQYQKKCANAIKMITEKLISQHKEDEFLKKYIVINIKGLFALESIQKQSQELG